MKDGLGPSYIKGIDTPTGEIGETFLRKAQESKIDETRWPISDGGDEYRYPDTSESWDRLVFLTYVHNEKKEFWLKELKDLCNGVEKPASTTGMASFILANKKALWEAYQNPLTRLLAEFVIRVLPLIEIDNTVPKTQIKCQVKP